MPHTLESQSQQHNNTYTALEAAYHAATSSELILDPYRSAFNAGPELTLSASVVIPAWNARDTLEQCLIAIEQSTFNCKYQEQLEVVVVDDGSTDGTWELLQQLRLNVRIKAVRQAHHSRAHTQNTGIAVAEGNVIICCDADMILTPFTIEEMVRRHQVLDRVMLIGFRGDVQRDDPRIQPEVLREHLPRFLPPFERDVRLNYGVGWPESMCRDTDHLKRLGEGKYHITSDGIQWTLSNMVYGALFSLARKDFTAMDGYDERFYGWGCEDTLVGVRTLALENYIVPVYCAAGLHIAHGDRSPRKWQEFMANRRVFQAILRAPFTSGTKQWLVHANQRVREHFERAPVERVEMSPCLEEEGELLIALALRAIMDCQSDEPPVLIEIGSYCGRATVAMGLAAQGVGRNDVRIIAVDEPDVGRAPEGGPPQDALRENLAAHGLSDMVICAPQDDAEPWQRTSRLVLVDGRHDYAGVCDDVERYSPRIAPGGYLVFHDYADYCPDVQRYVNEMLVDPDCPFEFVAHVNTLIAFVRRPVTAIERTEQPSVRHVSSVPTIWIYWEGAMPAYISLCCRTIFTHNEHVRLLNRASFDNLFMHDRDINIDALGVQHRSDFIRTYLLKHYGGLYLDVDCVVMRSLSPLLDVVKQYGFVGYREQQGNMSNGLMATEAHNDIITEHYHNVCIALRSGVHLEWCDLGSVSLDKVIAEYPGKYHLLPTESIMPINWNHSEELSIQRSDNEHEGYLQRDAFCYMLSNSTISGREQTKILTTLSEEELLKADYFLSFLFRRVLGDG